MERVERIETTPMKNRSVTETLTSFALLGGVYFVVSLIENQLDANLIDLAPIPIRQNESLFWLISLAALILIFIAMIIVQNGVTDTPLSRLKSRLKTALEVLAGLLAALSAILGNDVMFSIGPLESFIQSHRPQSSFALLVFLVVLLAAVPAVRFWITWNNLLGIRDAHKLLDALDDRAHEHLNNTMTNPREHFRLPVNELPGAVQPIPITGNAADQSPPAKPYHAGHAGSQRATRQNSIPLWELGKTSREIWAIFQKDFESRDDRRQLLILGGAGGGKSTQLYLLDLHLVADARDILGAAWRDRPRFWRRQLNRLLFWRYRPPNYQIPRLPVMLDFSTWPTTHATLDKWIIDATVRDYGIHRAAAKAWMRDGKFLPLLDALDVLEADQQPECINAINTWLEGNPSRPLVVCCRMDEYQAFLEGDKGDRKRNGDGEGNDNGKSAADHAGQPLKLRHAMQLGEVDPEEVREKLGGVPHLVDDINNDHGELLKILRNPLLLSLSLLNLEALRRQGKGNGEWGSVLFKDFVMNVVRKDTPTAESKIIKEIEFRLAWLGMVLQRSNELVFLTSDLQRDSLPSDQDRTRFDRQVTWINRILGLVIGCIPAIVFAALVITVYGMGGGIVFEQGSPSSMVTIAIIVAGAISALGLAIGVRRVDPRGTITLDLRLLKDDHDLRTGAWWRRLGWRAQRFWRTLVHRTIGAQVGRWQTLLLMLGIGVLVTLAIIAAGGLGSSRFGAPLVGFAVGILVGGLVGPDGGLFARWASKQHPDYLYRSAMRRAIRVLLFYVLLGMVAGSVVAGFLIGGYTLGTLQLGDVIRVTLRGAELGGVGGALIVGLYVGLDAALTHSGIDALLHFALRHNLAKSKGMPRNLVRFLEDASSKTLLRRNQRGYTFIVKSEKLRDVFAELYWPKYAELFTPDRLEKTSHRHVLGEPRCPLCERRRSRLVRGVIGFFRITPRRSPASPASPSLAQERAAGAEKATARP